MIRAQAERQGALGIEQMCRLADVSRAGYYRHWRASEPAREETALRDRVQRLHLAHRHYGYRRIGALLRREGWAVNHKRLLRLMREDNLLCLRQAAFRPATTDARHGWRVWPNLASVPVPLERISVYLPPRRTLLELGGNPLFISRRCFRGGGCFRLAI